MRHLYRRTRSSTHINFEVWDAILSLADRTFSTQAMPTFRHLAAMHVDLGIPTSAYPKLREVGIPVGWCVYRCFLHIDVSLAQTSQVFRSLVRAFSLACPYVFRADGFRVVPAGINLVLVQQRNTYEGSAFDIQNVFCAAFPGQVLMDVLNDHMEGLSGDSEESVALRKLWEQTWRRTAIQVSSGTPSNAIIYVAIGTARSKRDSRTNQPKIQNCM